MPDEHTVRPRDGEELPVGSALNITSNPEFTDAKIFKYCRQPSKMILVGMREGDNINSFEPTRPQIRRNDILTNINSGAHSARMKIAEFATSIDQHRASPREGEEKAVALAHVEHGQFQAMRREMRGEWMRGDDSSSG